MNHLSRGNPIRDRVCKLFRSKWRQRANKLMANYDSVPQSSPGAQGRGKGGMMWQQQPQTLRGNDKFHLARRVGWWRSLAPSSSNVSASASVGWQLAAATPDPLLATASPPMVGPPPQQLQTESAEKPRRGTDEQTAAKAIIIIHHTNKHSFN